MEKNPATAAKLLRAVRGARAGVAQLAGELGIGPSRLIVLLAELEDAGLIVTESTAPARAGRPKRRVQATELGLEYLASSEALALVPLRSRREDLVKASADGLYARRLSEENSPYELFLELNRVARRT